MRITAKQFKHLFSQIISTTLWLTLILFLLDIYTYFFVENVYLRELFNFASEKTPATWLSSTILLILGVVFLLFWKFFKEKKWIYISYFFIYLSLDDAAYVHEQISSWITNESDFLLGLPSYGWLYIIAPFIFIGLSFTYLQIYKKLREYQLTIKSLVISFFTLGFTVMLDFLDGYFSESFLTVIQTHYLRVTEEALEIVAFAFLLCSVSLLIVEINIAKEKNNGKEIYKKNIYKRG